MRDYVHVSDLASAHVLAMRRLFSGGANLIANLGVRQGFSVRRSSTRSPRSPTGPSGSARHRAARATPPVLVAACERARREFGWPARYTDLSDQAEHVAATFRRLQERAAQPV